MKIKWLILLLFPNLFLADTINFQIALDLAIQNNKELKAKKFDIETAKLSLDEAKSYDYGKLVFSENISNTNHAGYVFGMKTASREATFDDFGFGHFIDNIGGLMNPSTSDSTKQELLNHVPAELNKPSSRTNYETKISYQIPIFTGYKLENAEKIAKLQILASNAKFNYDEKQLGLEVFKAYNGVVTAKEFIKSIKKTKEFTASLVNLSNEFFKEGLITDIDVKQAFLYDMNIDTKLIQAENKYELTLAYLRFLTDNENITDVMGFENINVDTTNLDILQKNGLSMREDLRYINYNVDIFQKRIDYEDANSYPQIASSFEYGYNNNELKFSDEQDYYLVALGMNYTLFDAGLTKIKKEKAKVDYLKNSFLLEYMKDNIKLEIMNNLLDLNAKDKIYKQKIMAENLSKDILYKSIEMYKNQLINMNNLLQQQANEQQARAETIFTKYEKNISSAKLKISLGQSLKENK